MLRPPSAVEYDADPFCVALAVSCESVSVFDVHYLNEAITVRKKM